MNDEQIIKEAMQCLISAQHHYADGDDKMGDYETSRAKEKLAQATAAEKLEKNKLSELIGTIRRIDSHKLSKGWVIEQLEALTSKE